MSILSEGRGDPTAPPGSRSWAVAVRMQIQGYLKDAQTNVQAVRGRVKLMERYAGYAALDDASGKAFASFSEFCRARQPYGLGYDPDVIEAIKAEEKNLTLAALKEEMIERARAAPLKGHGGKRSRDDEDDGQVEHINLGGTSAEYLARRLARDAPEILNRLEAGEFKSVRAAAKEAGIVKAPEPGRMLRRWWGEADQATRLEFLEWAGVKMVRRAD